MNRTLRNKKALGFGTIDIDFSFAPNGSGAVDQATIEDGRSRIIKSVARTGVGVFDVELREGVMAVNNFKPSLQLATDADAAISSWTYTPATRKVTLRYRAAGTAADLAANAQNRIGGTLTVRDSDGK